MLVSGSQLLETPVMSLQTGKELARTSNVIIDPHSLSVIAYRLSGNHLDSDPSYLRTADIREMGSLGMIIDSSDEIIEPDDIVTKKDIYDLEYELDGKHVIDETQKKIGKVIDYVVDVDSFVIQQIVVKKPLLQSFSDDELLVHRSQIVEVNDTTIVIRSAKVSNKVETTISRHYINPFRQTSTQPDVARTDTEDN